MFKKTFYLILGVLLAISSGSVFIYPTYSYYIKNKFNFSLRQINLYATFINMGVWVAFGMGLIYDSCGSKLSSFITLILLPGGFFVLYKFIQSSSISLIWFLLIALIMGQGSSLAYTNALSTNVKNFSKKNSSNVIGLIISNSAIAPSLFASVKSSFSSMKITSFITFVLFYTLIVIVICFFCLDEIREGNNDNFRKKLFKEYKQKFIIFIFAHTNFIALLILIVILIINDIFGINIPGFIVFIVLHVAFFVFVFMENQHKFDGWLEERFNAAHSGINYIGQNRFEIIGRSVEVLDNKENSEHKNINNIKGLDNKDNKKNKNKKENNNDHNEENIRYSERTNISKIKDKYELQKNNENNDKDDNKKEKSLDINISKSLLKKSLDNYQNINNIGEFNNEANGRISIESNDEGKKNEQNKHKNDEEKEEKEKEELKEKEEDNNINNEKEQNNNNNNHENKDEKSNLEESIEKINSIQKNDKEDNINNDNQNNNINNDNSGSIDNGAKKIKVVDDNKGENIDENNKSKEQDKTEKLDDSEVNYPKFSMNSSNNNNNNEVINVPNNYPKFSITSEKTDDDNPYISKEEEKPKFSIADKENNNKDNNIQNNTFNKNIIKTNSNDNKEKNIEITNQKEINNKNNQQSPDINYQTLNTDINMINNNVNNNNVNVINTHMNFFPFNNTSNILEEADEKEDDNTEDYSRSVFLLSLFRRPQIMFLFVVLILTMGSIISNVNNIKFIVVSIDPNKSIDSTSLDKYPLLYFAFNSLTRIGISGISSQLMGTDEAFTILISITIIGLISQIFGFFMTKFFVFLSISLAGVTHGGIMTFVPLYCRYYFNLKNIGTVLGFLTTGNAVGSIIIATLIFPHYYHKYSTVDKNNEEVCTVKKCFRYSYFFNCLFLIAAIGFSYHLYVVDKNKKIQKRTEKQKKIMNSTLCSFNDKDADIDIDNTKQTIEIKV